MKNYIDALKNYIKENALKMLKDKGNVFSYPFIDPGAGYEGNLWDWDSFWSAHALFDYLEFYKEDENFDYKGLKSKIIEHAKGNVLNFCNLQLDDGFIAMVTTVQGLFSSYLKDCHLKGEKVNQHKPFLCKSALMVSEYSGDYTWFDANSLKKYLEYYNLNQFDSKSGLYFWRNDVMIGIDNNPTVFGMPDDCIADIYLNCFLYTEFTAMATLLEGRGENGEIYAQKAAELKAAIRRELYDVRDDLYYSAYLNVRTNKTEYFHHGVGVFWNSIPLKVRFWACFLPIMCGITTAEEGRRILEKHYLNDGMSCEYGVRTVDKYEKMYNTQASSNPSNWLGPVWTIANYCVYIALKKSGMNAQAKDLATKTIKMLGADVIENGGMSESYYPDTGKPMFYNGFLNWNVLVLEMIRDYEN